MRDYAGALSAWVLERADRDDVLAVFAGGSVATGDVSGYQGDDGLEVYSDVDLYVVLDDRVDPEALKSRLGPPPGMDAPDLAFVSPPDVGVYTLADLSAQPARPGTAFLREHHLHLYGDENAYMPALESIGNSIAPEEALYLLENRLSELSRDPVSQQPRIGRYRRFFVEKFALDIGGAMLIPRGDYTSSRRERAQRVAAMAGKGELEAHVAETVQSAQHNISNLQAFLSPSGEPDRETRVVALALRVWRAIAAEEYELPDGSWPDLVHRRCEDKAYSRNLREYVNLRARGGRGKWASLGPGLTRCRFAPVASLRVAALVRYARSMGELPEGESLSQFERHLDRLTASCGFTRGSLFERSAGMFASIQ